jgi:hypothetical protein
MERRRRMPHRKCGHQPRRAGPCGRELPRL